MTEKPKVYWAYNSFGHYHPVPLAGKRAQEFIDKKNQEKGGFWSLHTQDQYDDWYNKKGKHLEFIREMEKN